MQASPQDGNPTRAADWIYRNLAKVHRAIDDAHAGRLTFDYQPGHPLGFANIYYAAEVHHVGVLHDPDDQLTAFKQTLVSS